MKKITLTLSLSVYACFVALANNWGLQGSGTVADPYQVSNAQDFRLIAEKISETNNGMGEYFVMTNDIDFGGSADSPQQLPAIGRDGVTLVASVQWGFEGTFDGGNHTITGIYHTECDNNKKGQFNGLFSHIGPNATIKNLIFGTNNYIKSYNYVAPFVSLSQGNIINCHNYADIEATNAFAAGICGHMLLGNGSVINCENHGNINSMSYASGIVGGAQGNPAWNIDVYKYIVTECINYGTMTSTNDTGNAGIAGSFSGTITNCSNFGVVNGWKNEYKYGQYSGGIVSCASYPILITDCVNNGSVIGQKNSGGIVGNIMKGLGDEFELTSCINNGTVTGYGDNIGGIIGYTLREQNKISVSGCYNNAEVKTADGFSNVGNIRGNSLIALGNGNYIAEGLEKYELDGDTPYYNPNASTNVWGLTGEGTIENPYQISTFEDFMLIAEKISADNTGLGEYFKMMNDIDFGGSTSNPVQLPSIGKAAITNVSNVAWGFEGTFDGDNHEINGVYHTNNANNKDGQFNAIFSSLGVNGVLKNIVFGKNNYVNSYNYVAPFASISKGLIENCINNADITATNAFASGICGQMIGGQGSIISCTNNGSINAMTYAVGIIAGTQSGAAVSEYNYLVENCENNGMMTTLNDVGVAGIAGSYSGSLIGCTNNGEINGNANGKSTAQYAAGVVASVSYPVEISDCVNYGKVVGVKNVAGVLAVVMVGDQTAFKLDSCKNYGEISASGDYVAGIAANTMRGSADNQLVSVANSYNGGVVTSTSATQYIGNIRGTSAIALGDGNSIEANLNRYALDDDTESGIINAVVSDCNSRFNDGKYIIDGEILIIRNGRFYNLQGIELKK